MKRLPIILFVFALFASPTLGQGAAAQPEFGGRAALAFAGAEADVVGAQEMYGLKGGPALERGRFRLRSEIALMMAGKPAHVRRELGVCPKASCQTLFTWLSGTVVVDVLPEESVTRLFLGVGATTGAVAGWHVAGDLVLGRWGIGAEGGPRYAAVSVFLYR